MDYTKPLKADGVNLRLFDEDPLTGTRTFFRPLNDEGDFQLITQQDHEPFMQDALDERNAHSSKATRKWKGEVHKVASIPMALAMELMRKGIAFDQQEFRKWLNAPENRVFRTKPGKV